MLRPTPAAEAATLCAHLVPGLTGAGRWIVQPPVKFAFMPIGDRYFLGRGGKTILDLFEQLQPLGGWEPQDLVAKSLRSHDSNLATRTDAAQPARVEA
jgi:hypothetical protein